MKRNLIVLVCLFVGLSVVIGGCANMSATQKGAVGGAAVGAIGGQIIGGNTTATLIGAGAGALGGALLNDHVDRKKQ